MTDHYERIDRAGKVIFETSRSDEGTISATGARKIAVVLEQRGMLGRPNPDQPSNPGLPVHEIECWVCHGAGCLPSNGQDCPMCEAYGTVHVVLRRYLAGMPLRQRYLEWSAAAARLSDQENDCENVPASEWERLDDLGFSTLRELAEQLGWNVGREQSEPKPSKEWFGFPQEPTPKSPKAAAKLLEADAEHERQLRVRYRPMSELAAEDYDFEKRENG